MARSGIAIAILSVVRSNRFETGRSRGGSRFNMERSEEARPERNTFGVLVVGCSGLAFFRFHSRRAAKSLPNREASRGKSRLLEVFALGSFVALGVFDPMRTQHAIAAGFGWTGLLTTPMDGSRSVQ